MYCIQQLNLLRISDDLLQVIKVVKPAMVISNTLAWKSAHDALTIYDADIPLITLEMSTSSLRGDLHLKDFHLGVVEDPETHAALVMCSSGSTGKHKAVEMTHFRWLSLLYVDAFP